jgi:chorismate-pyruvate lyase
MSLWTHMNSIDTGGLDLVQRVMLASDGTLTDVLEVAFQEPIRVVKLAMQLCETGSTCALVDPDTIQSTIERKVILAGANSCTPYVYAESWIAIDRLPASLRELLFQSGAAIGRQWEECKIETRKELLSAARLRNSRARMYIPADPSVDWLERAYRLFSGGRPIMLIKEYFPCRYPSSCPARVGDEDEMPAVPTHRNVPEHYAVAAAGALDRGEAGTSLRESSRGITFFFSVENHLSRCKLHLRSRKNSGVISPSGQYSRSVLPRLPRKSRRKRLRCESGAKRFAERAAVSSRNHLPRLACGWKVSF